MRDIMQISYEASQTASNPLEYREQFTKMLFEEFAKMKSADIAPHLSCDFNILKHEYRVTLVFQVGFDEANTIKRDIK